MRFLASLRVRLVLLVLLAILPVLGLMLYSNLEQRRLAADEVRGNTLRFVHFVSENQAQLVTGVHQLLIALAQLPEVRGQDTAACNDLFSRLLGQYPAYGNLGLSDLNGDVICSAVPLQGPVNIADRGYFRQAVERGEFAVGEYQIGRITGTPTLNFGYPVRDEQGGIRAVVYAALDLSWLNQLLANVQLPDEAVLLLVDRNGTVVARYPDLGSGAGQSVLEASLAQAILDRRGEGTERLAGPDGVRRLYAFAPLGNDPLADVYVSVGIPEAIAFAPANLLFVRSLVASIVVAAVAGAAAWYIGGAFILRRVGPLVAATKRLGAGDLRARSGMAYGAGELSDLARTFDETAASLEDQISKRERTEVELSRRAEELAALQATVLGITTPHDLPTLLQTIVERAANLLGVESGGLFLCDPVKREVRCVVSHNMPQDFTGTVLPYGEGAAGTVAQTGQPLTIHDYRAWGGRAAVYQDGQPRLTVLSAPMIWQGRVVGVVNVVGPAQARRFTTGDLELLSLLANHAAIAVENARLLESERAQREEMEARVADLRDRERYLTLLNEITQTALKTPDFETLLQTLARRLAELTGADGCCLTLWDEETQTSIPVAACGVLSPAHADPPAAPGEVTMTGSVLRARRPLVAEDVLNSPYTSPRIAAQYPARSMLGLPLIAGGDGLGAALIAFDRPHQFTPEEIARGDQAAGQIALAVAEARLVRTEQEQRELAETLREVAGALTTSLDRERVLELILDQLARVVEFDSASVMLLAGDFIHVVARRSNRTDETGYSRIPMRVDELRHVREALESRLPLIIPDTSKDSRWRRFPGTEHIHAWLGVSLIAHDQVIGLLNLNKDRIGHYTSRHAELARVFAGQAAIAIANARLFEDTRRRAGQLAILNDLAREMTGLLDVQELCQSVASRLWQAFGFFNVGVFLFDPASRELVLQAMEGAYASATRPGEHRQKVGVGLVGRAAETGEVQRGSDTRERSEFSELDGMQILSEMAVPMKLGRRVVGVLDVDSNRVGAFDESDLATLAIAADQLSIALEKARLFEDARRRDAILEAVAHAAEQFLRTATLEQGMPSVLSRLGLALGISRVYVFQNRPETDGILLTSRQYEWSLPDLAPPSENPGRQSPSLLAAGLGRWEMALSRGESIYGALRDFPESEQTVLTSQAIRSIALVPIFVGSRWWGFIGFDDCVTERNWSHAEMDALRTAAELLGAAIQRQESEAAERELRVLAEALRDTASTLNGTLNYDEVLDRVLDNVDRVVPHDTVSIMLVEGGETRVIRARGFHDPRVLEKVLSRRFPVDDFPALHLMTQTNRAVVIPDTQTFPGWIGVPETNWIRSHVSAPMRVRGQVVGLLNLDSATPGFFTPTHAERLQAFADQAASAMENARLLAETARRATEFSALYDLIGDLGTQRELPVLLKTIVERATSLLGAFGGAIYLYDPARNDLEVVLEKGGYVTAGTRLAMGEGASGRVAESRRSLIVDDYHRWVGRSPNFGDIPFRAVLHVPMLYRGELVGVLGVHEYGSSDRKFSEADMRLLTLFGGQAASAVHNARLFAEAGRRLENLQALHAVDMAISANLDLRVTLNVLLDQVTTQLAIHAADVLLIDPHSQVLEFAAGRGFRTTALQPLRLRLGEGHAGRAALERHAVRIDDLAREPDDRGRGLLLKSEGFVGYYVTPLIAKGQVKGVLEVFHRGPLSADSEWMDFLEALALQTAIAIDNTELFDSLQRSNVDLTLAYDATIEGWSRALDLRDDGTDGHAHRVTEMTLALARAMGMPESELVHVRRGGLLHDIGKVGIPDRILLKPGPLTPAEWEIMSRHPSYAYEMLSPIGYLRKALDIPYCHHEKWDGTGYPRKLKGNQIPLAARVFAVVDVWVALRSDRPYRPAWPEEKVRAHLKSLAGIHFDPQAVETFLQMDPDT